MKRHTHARPVSRAAAPRAARYNHQPNPDDYGPLRNGPSPRAHQLAPLPGSAKPPRKPRRLAAKPTPPPAVLVYRQVTSDYLASFGSIDRKFALFSQPHPLPPDLTAFPVQYLCRPQARYTNPNQCDLILQSPGKVFLSGLRSTPVSERGQLMGITSMGVGDYKADRRNRELVGHTLVTLYGKPDTYGTPGWLVLLVSSKPYAPKHRNANARTAASLLREVLPSLRGWLMPLLGGETGPCETSE